jgi:hypothetical protein
VTSADLDGDGDVDLGVACLDVVPGSVSVLINQGNATFWPSPTYPMGTWPQYLVSGDLDGDGDVDLASANESSNTLAVLRNHGNATFAAAQVQAVGTQPRSVAAADLDGDGDLDLATANFLSADVSVLRNLGNATFAPQVLHRVAPGPRAVTAADLDVDGDLDLVSANFGSQSLSVLTNAGNGTFAPQRQFASGATPVSLAAPDVDGDGDPDLVLGMSLAPNVPALSVLRNCATSGVPFAIGDGVLVSCPCANHSAVGAAAGCLNSLGLGATLRATGAASLTIDGLVLGAAGMPSSSALFFQGTTNGGSGTPLGDGLLGPGGRLIRLGTKAIVAGASAYPGPADPRVSVRGAVTAPGMRTYQAYYRNAANFCTPATFNLTNAVAVAWRP